MKNMRIDNKFTGSTDFLTISKCKKSELHTSSPELKTFKQVYKQKQRFVISGSRDEKNHNFKNIQTNKNPMKST